MESMEVDWQPDMPTVLALQFPDWINEIRQLDLTVRPKRIKVFVVACKLKDGRFITFNGETKRAHISDVSEEKSE